MKIIQEICDEPGKFIPSPAEAIKRMERLPLPYTGNKKKLARQIHEAIYKNNLEFESVIDVFTGSASMAFLFKMMGKKVIANDILTSSYLNAVAFVENPGIVLTNEEKRFLLKNDNPNKNTFVEYNYLALCDRKKGQTCRFNKFTLKECRHLDNFRANIDELCGIHSQSLGLVANAAVIMRLPFGNMDQSTDIMNHRRKQQKMYGEESANHDRRIGIYYDKNLNLDFNTWFIKYINNFIKNGSTEKVDEATKNKIKRASFLANLQQHVLRDCFVGGRMNKGQVLAEIDARLAHQKNQLKALSDNNGSTEMDFFTDSGKPGQGLKWWSLSDIISNGNCIATNMDSIEILKSNVTDGVQCAYFDPPYGGQSSDYCSMYRFLEEYIYSDVMENLEHITKYGDRFVKKSSYEENFREMLLAAKKIPIWLLSYNDKSWEDIETIKGIIKEYRKKVKVEILTEEYRYLYRKNQGRKDKSCEYLIIAED